MSTGAKWFKHYNKASYGNSMKLLWAERDYETIAFWWRLLEMVSEWEKPERRGEIIISYKLLKRELGWNFQRSARVLLKIAQSFQVKIDPIIEGETYQVLIPNWLELQENRGVKKRKKNVKNPEEERRKKKEERIYTTEPSSDLKFPPSWLFDLWLENTKNGLQKFTKVSDKRQKLATRQIKKYPDQSHWLLAINKFIEVEFLRNNFGIDDFLAEDKRLKAIEGRYKDWKKESKVRPEDTWG